jgi:argininosuccinate lyase
MIKTLRIRTEYTRQALRSGYILATDLADYLVKKGEAFRTAHGIVAELVRHATKKDKSLSELGLAEYKEFSPLFGEDVYSITIESSIAARDVIGGTSPGQVNRALAAARKTVEQA